MPVGSFFDNTKYASGLATTDIISKKTDENLDFSVLTICNMRLYYTKY